MTKEKNKRGKKKVPERAMKEKIDHFKSETRNLRKEINNLKDRVKGLEKWIGKKITKEVREETDTPENKRDEMLRRFHPKFRDDTEDDE